MNCFEFSYVGYVARDGTGEGDSSSRFEKLVWILIILSIVVLIIVLVVIHHFYELRKYKQQYQQAVSRA